MEFKMDFETQQADAKHNLASQAQATAAEIDIGHVKQVPLLKCGTVMLQNFEDEYGEPGRQLLLVREPDNQHDRWATKVCTLSGTMLGYLPAWKNQSVARLIDAGKVVTVFVDECSHIDEKGYFIRSNESPQLPLVIYLEIADQQED